MAAITVLTK